MDALRLVHTYVDAWNRHDAAAVVACFGDGGTYEDPASGPLSGDAIGEYAGGLFAAFPDVAFDIVSALPGGSDLVALQWVMRGTNRGPFQGWPPTGRAVTLPGADFITVADGGLRRVTGYFDQKQFAAQLGLQTIVQPAALGGVRFGTCVRMSGDGVRRPGAFSLTSIHARSEAETAEIDALASAVLEQLATTPGFISTVLTTVGLVGHTMTAWDDAEAPKQLLRSAAHKEAMARFFGPDLAAGGMTSVWGPARIGASWVRCRSCGRMLNHDQHAGGSGCGCGASLPERLPYW